MSSATLKLFLVYGDPKRLRTAEQFNWTGLALAAPRSELEALTAREESDRPGVYFLTGQDDATGRPCVYIGEAESVRVRLKQHLSKDFWQQAIFFVSKDENLTKSHIRYLEGALIERANSAGRAVVLNDKSSGARLPESDRADMDLFLERIRQLLPVLGTDFLVPITAPTDSSEPRVLLRFEAKGAIATGYRTPSGFVVKEGSTAVASLRESAQKYPWILRLRDKHIQAGNLVPEGEHYRFSKDTEFDSASGAATVVCGGTANGLTSWRDPHGRTLKDIEAESAGSTSNEN